ncbi:XRE family transcriptional regulator [Streptococcus agalactiae LDS 628]|uniref:helix-turn-helix transcriptional regulator n=1 Tax=Streptococcus agalactiae TaxID=1311 RepID=UPI0002BB7CC1|nr:helix-turn-helix transcriptional regulator [Streptococcus agalactiae]EPU43257.1 XRE family transcriptional regulator [Streptococcus agalactiae LDS 628]
MLFLFCRKFFDSGSQRKLAKLTQSQLADLLETNQQTVGMMENGRRRTTIQDLVKLCKIFNASADDFLPKN